MMFIFIMSLVYISLISAIYMSKQKVETLDNKIYTRIIFVNIVGLLIDISQYLAIQHSLNPILITILNKAFLIYINIWTFLFTTYVFNIGYSKDNNKINFLKKLTVASLIIFVISAIVLPIHYYYDGGNIIYSYGLGATVTYAAGLFYSTMMALTMILNFKHTNSLERKKYIPLGFFLLLGFIEAVVQIIRPDMLLLSSLETLVTILTFFFIENPDVKMISELEIAKETADKANDSKTEFLSSMSHEIRTPLNAIVGFSDCIVDAKSLEEAKENAKDIVNASQTLLEIVNGILDISKIEAGKMEIVNTKYNARELFTEMAKLITPRMKEKGLDFTYSIDPNLPATLFGDKANLKKIVTNFLSNACKYTDRGFVRYEVRSVKLGDYCRLIISVEDSGRGIKKESVDKLFTRFQRLDEDRNTTIEGTGLGLAITKQLTELMGGKVIVHTVYGQGSKFTAVINQKIESMDAVEDNSVHTSLDLSNVRILIVDDAPLNIKVATKLFQKYNANMVDSCSSGFECINKIKAGNVYDLIFMDDMMPKLSGVETFNKLKEDPNFDVPTIALTANALTGMREKYLAIGFDDYLAKPIEQNELIRSCNTILGKGKDIVNTSIPEIVETEDINEEEKSEIIPVEENIEEIIGDAAQMEGKFKSSVDKPVVEEEIEILDDWATPSYDVPTLIPVADIDYPAKKETSDEVFDRSYLENNGVDVNKALEMLGDMDMYNSTINDFVSEVEEKWQRLNDYLKDENMEDYAIDVHSLKSDCKYLGFMSLADIAYEHELKSKEKDINFVKDNFSRLEEEYNKTLEIAKKYAEHNPVNE